MMMGFLGLRSSKHIMMGVLGLRSFIHIVMGFLGTGIIQECFPIVGNIHKNNVFAEFFFT